MAFSYTLLLFVIATSIGYFAPVVQSSSATMYWDCCKPSGSWLMKAPVYNPVVTCEADGKTIVTGPRRDNPNSSGCGGGYEFQCSCQQPWTDTTNPTLGYGFVAMPSANEASQECACYVAEFADAKPGKIDTLFFQVINDGGDLVHDSFDILVPGMGVGAQQQGCPAQWKGTDMSKWGAQYGGLDKNAAGCKNLPADLQHGCMWRMNQWGDSVKLKGPPQRVRCSQAHIDRTGCQRKDEPTDTYKGRGLFVAAGNGYTPDSKVCGIGHSQGTNKANVKRRHAMMHMHH